MKKTLFLGVLFGVVSSIVILSAACTDAARPPVVVNSGGPTPAPAGDLHDDDAPRISLEEAKRDFDNKTAVFIDTHSNLTRLIFRERLIFRLTSPSLI
ncbi:MAG: hypothetical protein C4325_11450 [Blastocatellia bacterium]